MITPLRTTTVYTLAVWYRSARTCRGSSTGNPQSMTGSALGGGVIDDNDDLGSTQADPATIQEGEQGVGA